jgi:hypothetical protein
MRPTEIEATKRHIAAWDLSPEQVREALRLIIVTPLAIDDARDIARGALAESEGK